MKYVLVLFSGTEKVGFLKAQDEGCSWWSTFEEALLFPTVKAARREREKVKDLRPSQRIEIVSSSGESK